VIGPGFHTPARGDNRRAEQITPVRAKRPGADGLLPRDSYEDGPAAGESRDRRFICVFCGRTVAAPRDIIEVDGASVHEFANPDGVLFRICCFVKAEGCFASGDATGAHTWFRGYSWRYAHCRGCGVQLGWRYDSAASGFYGLILKHLAEGG